MTALKQYQRLEASGLWRATPEAQRREVIVSIGDATLVISDIRERPLTHWSLAAIARAGTDAGADPGTAVYHPDGDPGETLELAPDEEAMIAAIETLRSAVERHRPHPGRLRLSVTLAVLGVVVLLATLWLPQALRGQAVTVVPEVRRAEIGAALFRHIQRVTGPPCQTPEGRAALGRLARRIPGPDGPGHLAVMRNGVRGTVTLPGGTILIGRTLVEDYDDPDVVAGFLVAERLRGEMHDPLADLLRESPLWASFRLLTTGALDDTTLARYGEKLLTRPALTLDDETLLARFETAALRTTPYAYALDISGEATLPLIEADPMAGKEAAPVMPDADWLRLQAICGS